MNAHEACEFGLIDELIDDTGDVIVLDSPDSQVSLIENSSRKRLN